MENFELSKRVKELRMKKGFSQDELAELSGLSLRTIQRVENGETVSRGDTLKRLAVTLQVSADEILDWQEIEDKNVLIILNMSQLGFLAFPLLGIIIPLALWIVKKDTVKNVDKNGKAIINFQITWKIALVISCIIGLVFVGAMILIISPIVFYLFNITIILFNTWMVSKSKDVKYKPRFEILK